MSYVVYVNHPTSKARIHSTLCGKYTNHENDETINGYWSEAFENFSDAMSYAKATHKKHVDTCSLCNPK